MPNGGRIEYCKNYASIVGNGNNVGGIVGYIAGGTTTNKVIIENCSNRAKISATGHNVGGIVGIVGENGNIEINNCYNGHVVTGANEYDITGAYQVGGICGTVYGGNKVTNVRNDGTVNATGKNDYDNSYAGGIIANIDTTTNNKEVNIENVYNSNTGAVKGFKYVGCIFGGVKGTSNAKVTASHLYAEGSVSVTSGGSGYGAYAGYYKYLNFDYLYKDASIPSGSTQESGGSTTNTSGGHSGTIDATNPVPDELINLANL